MALVDLFLAEWKQLRDDACSTPSVAEAARLRHKLWRKEVGVAVIVLGAIALALNAARVLWGLAG